MQGMLSGLTVAAFGFLGAIVGLFFAAVTLLAGIWLTVPAWLPWVIIAFASAAGAIVGAILEATG